MRQLGPAMKKAAEITDFPVTMYDYSGECSKYTQRTEGKTVRLTKPSGSL